MRSRTALYSCKGRNKLQSAHELMSSQARKESISVNLNVEIQDIWISLTIQLDMSLLQRYFAWDFSKRFRPGTGHVQVRSLLITIPSSNRASGFATEQKHVTWEFQPGFVLKILAFFLSISPESILLLFVKGSLSNQCQHVPALPLLPLNNQHSGMEKRR